MPRRGREDGGLSKEEYDRQESGEGEEAGSWNKASDDVIRKRKKIVVRSRLAGSAPPPAKRANPFAPASKAANVFSGIKSSLTATPSSGALSSAAATATAGGAGASLEHKIGEVNASFAAWIKRQSQQHPTASWASGMQEYLKHLQSITATTPAPGFTLPANPGQAKKTPSVPTSSLFSLASKTAMAAPKPVPAATVSLFSKPAGSSAPPPKPDSVGNLPSAPPNTSASAADSSAGGSSSSVDGETEVIKERVKILRFKKDADDDNKWGSMGKHFLSILTNDATKKTRIIARDETPLAKININAHLYAGMKVERAGKKGLTLNVLDDKGITMYLVQTKSGENADRLVKEIKDRLPK